MKEVHKVMNSTEKELRDSLIIQLCNARTSGYSEKWIQFQRVPRQCTGNLQSCWLHFITEAKNLGRIKKKKKQNTTTSPCRINSSMCNDNTQSGRKTCKKLMLQGTCQNPSFLLKDTASCVGSCYYLLLRYFLHFVWTTWYQPCLFWSKLFSWVFEDCYEAHDRNTLYHPWALTLCLLSL